MEKPNLLHQFASYNCLFTLSATTQTDLDDRSFLTDPLFNIIASSKGISPPYLVGQVPAGLKGEAREEFGRKIRRAPDYEKSLDILGRDHDIFFENVNSF